MQLSLRLTPLPLSRRSGRGDPLPRMGQLITLTQPDGRSGRGSWAPLGSTLAGTAGTPALPTPWTVPRAKLDRQALEAWIRAIPADAPPSMACLGFALGSALGELDGLWRSPLPPLEPVGLLQEGAAALASLPTLQAQGIRRFKWKVAGAGLAAPEEQRLLTALLAQLPADSELRLDANGLWDPATCRGWLRILEDEPRIRWIEQPLAVDDPMLPELIETHGHRLALDESLANLRLLDVWLHRAMPAYLVLRASQLGDPRRLMDRIAAHPGRLVISTAFEGALARPVLDHLGGLAVASGAPAPGLAVGVAMEPETCWPATAAGSNERVGG
ncbi:MAG: hypothetical protein ERJ69_04595 [Aphanocapsa feldmannii 288cV]|nr:MAG: hypothetical protein ERJ69_04595 [Aphanocapsa feldmannii 288cV]